MNNKIITLSSNKKVGKNSQGSKTKLQLIQAAIECLASEGLHNVSFHSIARHAGVDQPLVVYHFKKKENIFYEVWDHVYNEALIATQKNVSTSTDPIERILNYIQVSIDFFTSSKPVSIIYFQFHYLAVFDEKAKQMNTEIKRRAVNRLAALIMDGQRSGIFHQNLDPYVSAKSIHGSIVGVGINSITEYPDFDLQQIVSTLKESTIRSLKIV